MANDWRWFARLRCKLTFASFTRHKAAKRFTIASAARASVSRTSVPCNVSNVYTIRCTGSSRYRRQTRRFSAQPVYRVRKGFVFLWLEHAADVGVQSCAPSVSVLVHRGSPDTHLLPALSNYPFAFAGALSPIYIARRTQNCRSQVKCISDNRS